MDKKNDIFDISVEVSAVSAIVAGLRIQFEDGNSRLSDDSMNLALFGVERYLDRIVNDIDGMEDNGEVLDHE